MYPKNIFVIGLNGFHRALLSTVTRADEFRFHGVLSTEEVADAPSYDVADLLDRAERQIRSPDCSIDAVVGYYDLPVSSMLPILCDRLGVATPSLESVLRCEHKYWSRLEQKQAVAECIPDFELVDPFDDDAVSRIDLAFPFWLKPVKSLGSYLGYRITDREVLDRALADIRANIGRVAEPFDFILEHAQLPPQVAHVTGRHCIAEGIIAGEQCTLEGYVFEGRPEVYGVVDSIRYANQVSFARYQYPSKLPRRVQERMTECATRVLEQIGLDRSAFNMEFYYEADADRIHLLEINPRISQSHCPLFESVHGVSHQEVMIDVALGVKPEYPPAGKRPYEIAAKFMLRETKDGVVDQVPSEARLHEIERAIPGTRIVLNVEQGTRLSHLEEQDSYMYQLAEIYTAGNSVRELREKYKECVEQMEMRIVPFGPRSPTVEVPARGAEAYL